MSTEPIPNEDVVQLRGVSTHNLKKIDCDIPHNVMTVVTGPSGSGKSSLAFDTLYAEGQRRYTESLSTYARQFLQRLERPPVDFIRNIKPAVALKQRNEVSNARSTVGTVTEIDDHLHLLYTHIGVTIDPESGEIVRRDTVTSALEDLLTLDEGTRLVIVAEVPIDVPEHRPLVLRQLVQQGYRRVFIDGQTVDIDQGDEVAAVLDLDTVPVVIDRVVIKDDQRMRLSEAVQAAFDLGKGRLLAYLHKGPSEPLRTYDRAFRSNSTGRTFTEPQPALFSFNSSLGACPVCSGFGRTIGLDFKKVVPNPSQTLKGGAIVPLESKRYGNYKTALLKMCRDEGVPINLPWRKLTREHQNWVKNGRANWIGVRRFFDQLRQKQFKTHVRIFLARYRGYDECGTCLGSRLGADARCVFVHGHRISDFWEMRIEEMREAFASIPFTDHERAASQVLIDEIAHRLAYLDRVGLGYLTLGRQSRTLSGGEMQRIHLTASLGRALTDTLYVLDEPTAGLHARDSDQLLEVLHQLRDLGNTVVVVEHDPDIIKGADHVIEIGPKGGEGGGELVFSGDKASFDSADTLTAGYMRERHVSESARAVDMGQGVDIVGARQNNLDDLNLRIPYDAMTAVTGVSGSGKSTLCHAVLYNNWRRSQGHSGVEAGDCDAIEGLERFDEVVLMSQSAIGRSSRSNALSYTKAYDDLRKLYAQTDAARKTGLTMGDFSFNTPGGRCENCQGNGTVTIEMHFMADVEIVCPECQGKRFTQRVLDATYRGKSIHDVLEMTVDDAIAFFADRAPVVRKLDPLREVGLGYLRLGQSTNTLSGGEAQRLKLATYIADGRKRGDTKPVLFIFDEPTVGLHLDDVSVLVSALRKLIDLGHTVVVIEHNIDFVAQCDHVIDLGPEAGPRGGTVVAQGSPRDVASVPESLTGRYLSEVFSGA